mmetsp:Transcript_67874/g.61014  ORF Transcript_67874/g.61014 Transcript_67874/m.61014 type:complete len:479 (-) Transcript_67874:315-1751(-)
MALITLLTILVSIVYGQKFVKKGPCDHTRECIRYDFTGDDRMLCYGYYGCKGASMGSSAKAVCAGANTCTRAKFTTKVDSILCNGFKSCLRGRSMVNNNKISCNGLKSCTDVVGGLTAPVIMCDGDIACTNFKSKKNSDLALNLNAVGKGDDSLLYCNGNQVCRATQQRSDGLIYCDGDGACKESRMQADAIECLGKRACKDAILQPYMSNSFSSLLCHGWFGCSGTSVIMAESIKAYGFNAMTASTIETRGIPVFNLKAYGFRALAGATIDCKGSECNIECKGNACKNVPISVAKSSTLNLLPAKCDPKKTDLCIEFSKNDPSICKKNQGTHCPAILYARSDQTEEEFEAYAAAWRQSYVDAYKLTDEYQENLEIIDIDEQEAETYLDDRIRDFEMENEYDDEEDDILYGLYEYDHGEEDVLYVFGDNANVSLMTQVTSSVIMTNLLVGIVTFLLTVGLIGIIMNKCVDKNVYKSLQ